jgi:hypothetical protein
MEYVLEERAEHCRADLATGLDGINAGIIGPQAFEKSGSVVGGGRGAF